MRLKHGNLEESETSQQTRLNNPGRIVEKYLNWGKPSLLKVFARESQSRDFFARNHYCCYKMNTTTMMQRECL